MALALLLLLGWGAARAAELSVVSSGGGLAALQAVAPLYEARSGNHLVLQFGPSMGATPGAIPARLDRGEAIDAVVMVGSALDALTASGKVIAAEDVARSRIGAAVRAGAARPDVATVEGLRGAMLAARVIAVSDSASGVYIQREMLAKLGIEAQVRDRIRVIPADPVGGVVASGGADLGFQQVSELRPVAGIEQLGPIADAVQLVTPYKAGVVAASLHRAEASDLLRFLLTPEARAKIAETGLEPVAP